MWVDTGSPTNATSATCVGLGTLFPDETDNATTNDNNQFGGFTRVDESCLDCNHDDYFSTNPTRGGYFDTHWNTADSRWFESVRGTRSRPSRETEDPSP